ncbi:MAG: ABC transporter permease [Acidilobus sp.]
MTAALPYDLRRSALNRTLIIVLAVVLVAGIGLTYLEAGVATSQGKTYYLVTYVLQNGSIVGLAVSPGGEPLPGVKVYTSGGIYETNSSGFLIITSSALGAAYAYVNGQNRSLFITMTAIVNVNYDKGTATLIFSVPYITGVNEYKVYFYQQELALRPKRTNSTLLGYFGPGIHLVSNLKVNVSMPGYVVELVPALNQSRDQAPGPTPGISVRVVTPTNGSITLAGVSQLLMARKLAAQALATTALVFSEFFPLSGLFVVNDLIARPRSTRAIEFILARPITRSQLLASRYSAGLFSMALWAAVAVVITGVVASALFGVPLRLASILVTFSSVAGQAMAFLSLLVLISVLTRRSYIAAAVVAYLLMYIFNPAYLLGLMGFTSAIYATPYSSAISIVDTYFGTSVFPVDYFYAVASIASWLLVSAALSFVIYPRLSEP